MDFCDVNPKIYLKKVFGRNWYFYSNNMPVESKMSQRIEKMAIPPCFTTFWISKDPENKIQAIWLDASGKKQYLYHSDWTSKRELLKKSRITRFEKKLTDFWTQVNEDINSKDSKTQMIAYMFLIIKETNIRIGNKKYLDKNDSQGLTTMKPENLSFKKGTAILSFIGKSGISHSLIIKDSRVVSFLKRRHKKNLWLFETDGIRIDSIDMNKYLQNIIGPSFTCKDFRTYAANKIFKEELEKLEATSSIKEKKKNVSKILDIVACQLGHNKSTSKKSYVSSSLIKSYLSPS